MKKLFFVAMVVFLLVGCSVNPSQVDDKYAKEFVDKTTYVKDHRVDICYAIVATRMTGDPYQNSITFTWVPCEKVEKLLVNK